VSARLRPFFLLAGWFMTHRTDEAPRREVIARWCTLAEQRLNYLTDMFESGRWRRYYSEVAFLENIREAKCAVETWRGLSTPHLARGVTSVEPARVTPELAQGVAAVELALSESAVPMSVRSPEPDRVSIAPEPFELAAEDEMVAEAPEFDSVETEPSEPIIDMLALEQALDVSDVVLDMSAIEARYPLLRNAL
jgi:uncharacterized repeat protein (TIGR03809 family)